jgi:hypothetical protein
MDQLALIPLSLQKWQSPFKPLLAVPRQTSSLAGGLVTRSSETKSFGRPLSSEVETMATPTGEMRGSIQSLNLS